MKQFTILRNEAGAGDGGGGGGGAGLMAGSPAAAAPAADGGAGSAAVPPTGGAAAAWSATPEILASERFQGKDLTKFAGKSGEDILESYMHLETYKGTPPAAIQVPNAETTPEDIAAYRQANSIPETAEAYEMTMPENLPEGISVNDAAMAGYKESFLKHNLTPAQAQGIMDDHLALAGADAGNQMKALEEAHKTNVADLRNEWGDKYESNLGNAQLAVTAFEDATGQSVDASLANNPAFVKFMAHAHELTAESTSTPTGRPPAGNHTMADAKALMSDLDSAYWNESDPGHAEAVNVVRSAQANQRS